MSLDQDYTTVTNSLDRHDRPAHEALQRIWKAIPKKSYEAGLDKEFTDEIHEEAWKAVMDHGNFNSDHEAFAVLLEEIDEIKEWVWKKRKNRDRAAMRKELVQISAVCWKWASQLKELGK